MQESKPSLHPMTIITLIRNILLLLKVKNGFVYFSVQYSCRRCLFGSRDTQVKTLVPKYRMGMINMYTTPCGIASRIRLPQQLPKKKKKCATDCGRCRGSRGKKAKNTPRLRLSKSTGIILISKHCHAGRVSHLFVL